MTTTPLHHRKIDLQSTTDLHYLQTNLTRSAAQKIDLHFPPAAAPRDGSEDGLKKKVEAYVSGYIDRTFEFARANVTVNGMDVDVGARGKSRVGDGELGEERFERLGNTYAVACADLLRLKAGVPEVVGRCERAARVAAEVEMG